VSNLTALGIELEYDETDMETMSPLNCVVVAEAMNSSGNLCHVVIPSKGLGEVAAAGLLAFANQWSDWNLRIQLLNGVPDDSEEE
jgi:hypothetical protein